MCNGRSDVYCTQHTKARALKPALSDQAFARKCSRNMRVFTEACLAGRAGSQVWIFKRGLGQLWYRQIPSIWSNVTFSGWPGTWRQEWTTDVLPQTDPLRVRRTTPGVLHVCWCLLYISCKPRATTATQANGGFRPWGPAEKTQNSWDRLNFDSLSTQFRNQEKGVFRRGFLQGVCLSWPWRSECQTYCWAQYPWIFFVSLGVTLDSAETSFAKTPLSWNLINFEFFGPPRPNFGAAAGSSVDLGTQGAQQPDEEEEDEEDEDEPEHPQGPSPSALGLLDKEHEDLLSELCGDQEEALHFGHFVPLHFEPEGPKWPLLARPENPTKHPMQILRHVWAVVFLFGVLSWRWRAQQVGGILNSTWNYNSHETTIFEMFQFSTSWGPKAATAVKWRLLHRAIIER